METVEVWARKAAQAAALVNALNAQHIHAVGAPDLASAVARADIISCATLATVPLIEGAWLSPGSHLDLIGSFTAYMREADDACFAQARLYVDTPEAMQKSGDLLGPLSRGVISTASVQGSLADLCRGTVPGRQSVLERTVFKSVGTALEDLAAAILVYECT